MGAWAGGIRGIHIQNIYFFFFVKKTIQTLHILAHCSARVELERS